MSPRTGFAALSVALILLALGLAIEPPAPVTSSLAADPLTQLVRSRSVPQHLPSRSEARRSRRAFRGLPATAAKRVARTHFAPKLTGPVEGLPNLGRGQRIVSYADDYTARTQDPRGRGLLISTLPLRTRGADGRRHAVDLTLDTQGRTLRPRRPLVPTTLGVRLDSGFKLGELLTAIPLTTAGRAATRAQRLDSSRLFYPGTAPDTDFIAEPTMLGFEAYWQLRSPASPERFVLRHRLRPGVDLRQDGDAITILRDGKQVGQILPPSAFDASGQSVVVSQVLRGTDVELLVAHRQRRVVYPVLVDPYYVDPVDGNYYGEDWWHPGVNGDPTHPTIPTWHHGNPEGLEAWQSYTNNNFIGAGIVCNYNVSCLDGNAFGLFLQSQPGFYYNNSGAFYQFYGQGQGASTYIDHFEGAFIKATTQGAPVTATANFQILNPNGTVVNQSGNILNGAFAAADSASNSGGTVARVALAMVGDGTRPTWNSISVGAAQVHMRENSAPSLTAPGLSWSTAKWYLGDEPITTQPTFLNTGFGVHDIRVSYPTSAGQTVGEPIAAGCDGHYLTRCNFSFTAPAPIAIPTGAMPEGTNTIYLYAYSPSGRGSVQYPYTYKVDRSPPTVSFGGSLASHNGGEVAAGVPYDWSTTVTDCTGPGAAQRSGVRYVDIDEDAPPNSPLAIGSRARYYGSVDDCSFTRPDSLSFSPGPHTITVTATDWVGLIRTSTISVTAVPAPAPELPPVIAGPPNVGQSLTTTDGVWAGVPPLTYAYQWERCDPTDAISSGTGCVAIAGARAKSYRVAAADVGHSLRVVVTATNAGGTGWQPSLVTSAVNADGTPPAVTLGGTLYDHRGGYLYDASYGLTVDATDGATGDLETGVASIEVKVDGARKQFTEQDCLAGGCSMSATFNLASDEYSDAAHTALVTVLDKAGNAAQSQFSFTVDRRGDVYHAKLYTSDPAAGGTLEDEEWGRIRTHTGRSQTADQIVTRGPVPCDDTQPSGPQCGEYRARSRDSESDPNARDTFTRYRGTSEDDPRLQEAAVILVVPGGSPTTTGPISDAKASWQTLPPGAGGRYEVYESDQADDMSDQDDGSDGDPAAEALTMHVEIWVDSDTKMPIKQRVTASTGETATEYWTYDPTRQTPDQLPAGFFTVSAPTNQDESKSVEFRDDQQVGPQTDEETGASYSGWYFGTSSALPVGMLCLAGTSIGHLHEPGGDSITSTTAELAAEPFGPVSTVDVAYVLAETGAVCPSGAHELGTPQVEIHAAATSSTAAQTWTHAYQELGEAIQADPTNESFLRAGVTPVLVDSQPTTAYVIPFDDSTSGVLFEKAGTTVIVIGPFDKSDVALILGLLQPR